MEFKCSHVASEGRVSGNCYAGEDYESAQERQSVQEVFAFHVYILVLGSGRQSLRHYSYLVFNYLIAQPVPTFESVIKQ